MGLALDEFALWLELKDVYWEKDGRKSVDAMIVAGGAAGILLVGFSSWVTLADSVADKVVFGVGAFGVVGIGVAAINAVKQKLWWALASLVFWPAGVAPALRLAKPHSLWAHLFYKDERKHLCRERYPDAGAASGPPAATPAPEPEPSPSGSGSATSAS